MVLNVWLWYDCWCVLLGQSAILLSIIYDQIPQIVVGSCINNKKEKCSSSIYEMVSPHPSIQTTSKNQCNHYCNRYQITRISRLRIFRLKDPLMDCLSCLANTSLSYCRFYTSSGILSE